MRKIDRLRGVDLVGFCLGVCMFECHVKGKG
jgi:hypothetical protein